MYRRWGLHHVPGQVDLHRALGELNLTVVLFLPLTPLLYIESHEALSAADC